LSGTLGRNVSATMIITEIAGIPQFAAVPGLFHYHFMQNALMAGTVVAVLAGVIGYFMVLRSQSFAGHALANVGFAGATGAALFGIPPILGLFLSGLAAAFGIHSLDIGVGRSRRSDVATGAVFTASLALGFLFVHLSTAQANNIYDVLFGNVLGISDTDLLITAVSALVALALLLLAARPLLFASVDPVVAAARGVPVGGLSLGFLLVLALVVAVAVQVVGVLLIFALLITPAATARRLTSRPALAVGLSVALALLCTWFGLVAGYFTPLPVSFFITSSAFALYLLVRLCGGLFGRNGANLPRLDVGRRQH
jgi:zinc/manganese transport system permease protein